MKNKRTDYARDKMKCYRYELYEYQLKQLQKFLETQEMNDYVLNLLQKRLEKVKKNLCLNKPND